MGSLAALAVLLLSGCGLLLGADPATDAASTPDAAFDGANPDSSAGEGGVVDARADTSGIDAMPLDAAGDATGVEASIADADPDPIPVIDAGGFVAGLRLFEIPPGMRASRPLSARADKIFFELSEEPDPALLVARVVGPEGLVTNVPLVDPSYPDHVYLDPPSPLGDGWYCVEIAAAPSLAGVELDGEWMGAFPSGDGIAGGRFAYVFSVLLGDVDRNGVVGDLDISLATAFDPRADVDGDGVTGSTDLSIIMRQYGATLPPAPAALVGRTCPATTGG